MYLELYLIYKSRKITLATCLSRIPLGKAFLTKFFGSDSEIVNFYEREHNKQITLTKNFLTSNVQENKLLRMCVTVF